MTRVSLALGLVFLCACHPRTLEPDETPPASGGASGGAHGGTSGGAHGGTSGGDPTPVTGAGGVATGAAGARPPTTTGSGGSAPDPVATPLVVHEWGTFTSVGNSAGVLMEGLHHEEEALPAFVHGRAAMVSALPGGVTPTGEKSMETQPIGVTQKMETPVLYFYGGAAKGLRVRVDFPTGVVSQWYPSSAGFGPALGTVTVPKAGFMEWRFDLAPGLSTGAFPAVAADDIWAPSRNVASVPVVVGGESEQFIFYRGLGAFELPLSMTLDAGDNITIQNRSSDTSPAVFLLRVHPGGGAIIELGPLPGGGVLSNIPSPVGGKEHDLDVYVADAQQKIATALEATGLYADEARAMVDTWSKSYFKSDGLRILYVVPRAWTDKLLPLTVEPTPTAVVRTLVGRVELLAPSEERALLARAADATTRALAPADVINALGRLAEPKLRRALQLATDAAVRSWTERAITTAASGP